VKGESSGVNHSLIYDLLFEMFIVKNTKQDMKYCASIAYLSFIRSRVKVKHENRQT
jgi:hypothetical protein